MYQGINGFNPSAPSSYNLIGNRKFSGTVYSISNSFFGENWYPIRTDKQTLTGTFHHFSISNYGDESDWNINLLPNPGFEDFIADAIPYQRDNWYASGDWPADEQGHFLIEAEITPDEHRYGNPWFTNNNSQSTVLHKQVSVYGPFVREEAHGNHPEIHPCEQIWWKEAEDSYTVLLVTDDSNRFKRRADTMITVGGHQQFIAGDYTARRVTSFAYQPWTSEKKQESEIQVAFELNPLQDGYYVSIQSIDNLNFFAGASYPDVREGNKYSLTYRGNTVLTVEESSMIDPYVGVSFKNVCFNRAKGVLQGYIVFNTAIGNGDGKEGFVALRIDQKNVGVNAKPVIVTGDIGNTWKPFSDYDDKIPFSDIISSDMNGRGIVDGIIDFNGNGKSDLFAKQGDRWMVLYDGKGSWQEIQTSSLPVSELRFGDIDGNHKTDILRVGPNHKVFVSYDGVGTWTELTDAGEQNNLIQVGDFNGDHKTDLIYFKTRVISTGGFPQQVLYRGDMYVKFSGAGSWRQLNHDYYLNGPADYTDNFRFGNFNGDNITDVFRYYNGKFNVYWNGTGDIKELTKPPVAMRTSDLLFVTKLSSEKNTDVIYVDPVSKKWTVYYAGLPGSLPLTIKYADPANVRFADLDADPAVEPIAIDFVRGNPNNVNFPVAAQAIIEPSMQLRYVEGSLKSKSINNAVGLYYDQDVFYYAGTRTNRRRRPAEFEINAVKEMTTARALTFQPVAGINGSGDDLIKLGRVQDVPVTGSKKNSLQIAFKNSPEAFNKDIATMAITALPDKLEEVVTPNGNWASWQPYLLKIAKPNKKILLNNAPGIPATVRLVSFDLHPLYSGMEGNTARLVEMEDFIEELNEAVYDKSAAKRNELYGAGDIFTINWSFSLMNMNTGAPVTGTAANGTVQNGRFKNSKINFRFPGSQDLLQFTATATITDKFGNSNAEPQVFTFYNQKILQNNGATGMQQWLAPYTSFPAKPGFIWMTDHWERIRANEVYLSNQQLLARAAYLAEDKVISAEELKTLLEGY